MAEGAKSKKSLIVMILVIALVLGGYLFIKFLAPAQWHWRIYAYRALATDEGRLDPPAGYTGVWNNWDDTGRLLSRYVYKNGKRDGPYSTFDRSGEVISEGLYVDGGLEGIQSIKQEGGARTEVPFANGQRNGVERTWYPSGQLAVEAPWVDGMQEGSVVFYYENGSVQATIPFYRGQVQGVQKSWYEHGAVQSEETYRDNVKNGKSDFWRPDGVREMSLNYRDDVMDGVQTWFHPTGGKAREIELSMGTPNGFWREWDESGTQTVDDVYELGELKRKDEEASAVEIAEQQPASPETASANAPAPDSAPDGAAEEPKRSEN